MAEHYKLLFHQEPFSITDATDNSPPWSGYPMKTAQSSSLYKFDNTEMLRQKLYMDRFHIELFELQTKKAFEFRYRTTRNRLFLFFMLDGEIRFFTNRSESVTKVKKDNFYLAYNQPATYGVRFPKKGTTAVLVISINLEWAQAAIQSHPNLRRVFQDFRPSGKHLNIMPHCRMETRVKVWLRYLQDAANTNMKALKSILEGHISLALTYYEEFLSTHNKRDIYRLKEYLDLNYHDPELSVEKLTTLFPFTERSLYNAFIHQFQTTAVGYYTRLRMEKARQLIEEAGLPQSEVWQLVGYNDQGTFRQAYRNFKKRNFS
ncbi:AraC family transcriptional regulator [Albibacterium indicum]|uniref:AraC family transcriptional regulator n=1 Tax=Albibacterium indicum TaxID=2292082 RepID=UPI000E47C706|nr:AraC family transcriptional regulator [Pedobacter indicus]